MDAILDAAAEVVERVGSERVTAADVAARAGMTLGSVYRYFPDRVGILTALSVRNQARLTARLVEAFREPPATLALAVDRCVDAFVEHHRVEPSVRSLGMGDRIDLGADSVRSQWGVVARPFLDVIVDVFGVPRALAFAGIATMCPIADALVHTAFHEHAAGDPALLGHARAACRHALELALR